MITLALVALLLPAGSDAQIFNFPIDTVQEVPTPTIPAGVPIPMGTGMVTLDTDANMISWTIDYQDLTGSIVSPGAHFHGPAGPGATANVEIFLSDGDPPEPATGQLVGSAAVSDDQELDILAGLWYVNIHTELNGAGEIRGQVVPEPAAGLLASLACVCFWRRRRM
jgi:hypothetical protein